MKINKTIGILGGMGPKSSAYFYDRMIKYAQKRYNAVQDYDYPPIIIYSLPLVGFNETGITNKELVKKQLIKRVKKLENAGCDLLIICCNTAHIFFDDMQMAIKIPILNMIEKTVDKVEDFGYKKVGLFASQSMINMKVYQKKFIKKGIEVIIPNKEQQNILNKIIKNVMGGNKKTESTKLLTNIIKDYIDQSAEAIILGCTEIPLIINKNNNIKMIDPMEIITRYAVDISLGN